MLQTLGVSILAIGIIIIFGQTDRQIDKWHCPYNARIRCMLIMPPWVLRYVLDRNRPKSGIVIL